MWTKFGGDWSKTATCIATQTDKQTDKQTVKRTYLQKLKILASNNQHVYRQSQVRKPTGRGVEWAECSLIIGTGCRVQVFSLIHDSSVVLSTGIQSAGDLVSETLGSNPVFSRGRQLVSFRFEYRLPVPEHQN